MIIRTRYVPGARANGAAGIVATAVGRRHVAPIRHETSQTARHEAAALTLAQRVLGADASVVLVSVTEGRWQTGQTYAQPRYTWEATA